MLAGEFKPNSGGMVVDSLMRHGHVTPENEPNMLEIRREFSRSLHFALPS